MDFLMLKYKVRVAGCDGTFKTVPKFKKKDAYQIFTFQVIYKNVVSHNYYNQGIQYSQIYRVIFLSNNTQYFNKYIYIFFL